MKKIILSIISLFTFFSIANTYAENNWLLGEIMDFPYWVEDFKLKVDNLNYVKFYDSESQTLYNNFRATDSVLKDELIRQYREWKIDYYRMNWIVSEYNSYVYHANKMFSYISQKEKKYDSQLDSIILTHYTEARQYYDRAKYLIATKDEQKNENNNDYPYWWRTNNWANYPYSYTETIRDRWYQY